MPGTAGGPMMRWSVRSLRSARAVDAVSIAAASTHSPTVSARMFPPSRLTAASLECQESFG